VQGALFFERARPKKAELTERGRLIRMKAPEVNYGSEIHLRGPQGCKISHSGIKD
jgi:hypothetical protein